MSLFTDSQCHSIVFTRTRISSRNNFSFLLGQADWVLGGDAELLLAVKVDREGGDGAREPAVPLVVDLSKRVVCRPLLIVPIVLIVQFNAKSNLNTSARCDPQLALGWGRGRRRRSWGADPEGKLAHRSNPNLGGPHSHFSLQIKYILQFKEVKKKYKFLGRCRQL